MTREGLPSVEALAEAIGIVTGIGVQQTEYGIEYDLDGARRILGLALSRPSIGDGTLAGLQEFHRNHCQFWLHDGRCSHETDEERQTETAPDTVTGYLNPSQTRTILESVLLGRRFTGGLSESVIDEVMDRLADTSMVPT